MRTNHSIVYRSLFERVALAVRIARCEDLGCGLEYRASGQIGQLTHEPLGCSADGPVYIEDLATGSHHVLEYLRAGHAQWRASPDGRSR